MTIDPVTQETIHIAAKIHSLSWIDSHRAICSEEFLMAHTPDRQAEYIRSGIADGKRFFLLSDNGAKAVVSVKEDLIEDLYVLPSEQRKGYGSRLLHFAEAQCTGVPGLWILSNNAGAERLYRRLGYEFTGRANSLAPGLQELEMRLSL